MDTRVYPNTQLYIDGEWRPARSGRTMPVVPRIEMPPSSPSRAFVVCFAISSPRGTLIVTTAPRNALGASSRRAVTLRSVAGVP